MRSTIKSWESEKYDSKNFQAITLFGVPNIPLFHRESFVPARAALSSPSKSKRGNSVNVVLFPIPVEFRRRILVLCVEAK